MLMQILKKLGVIENKIEVICGINTSKVTKININIFKNFTNVKFVDLCDLQINILYYIFDSDKS